MAGDTVGIRGYCPLCISRCGTVSVVEDGRLTAVQADRNHPTGAAICAKGRAAPELVYAPERVLTPLRRTRPKGEADPGWQPIAWDEALRHIGDGMRRIAERDGPEAVAFAVATPSGTAVADSFPWVHRLANAFGSPNMLFATENCNWHRDFGAALTFGTGIGMPDFARTGCLVLWGANPAVTWPAMAHAALGAIGRGAQLVVVDPRRTGLGTRAGHWLGLRPGTDGPLAMALAGVLLDENLFDREFLLRWTNAALLVRSDDHSLLAADGGHLVWDQRSGRAVPHSPHAEDIDWALEGEVTVDTPAGPLSCRPVFDLLRRACREWTPDRAAAVTGVAPEMIRETAQLLHRARPVSWYTWTGTGQHAEATQTSRALGILYALTGCWDSAGGNVLFAKPPVRDVSGRDLLSKDQSRKTLGLAERPLGPPSRGWITSHDFIRAALKGEPYPVRGLVAFGGNPLVTKPHLDDHEDALASLDLYVQADMVLTPTARFADIVLPVASPWEREGVQAGFMIGSEADRLLQLRPRVLTPLGESRSDTRIVFDLATTLGLAPHFFGGDPEAGLAEMLAPTGVTASRLRESPGGIPMPVETQFQKYRRTGFATPTGLIELYSTRLHAAAQPPLPHFADPARDSRFPLALTSAKWPHFCHSQFRHLPSLRRRTPEPLVEISLLDARTRGIADGDWVEIVTERGTARARARLTETIRPGAVCAQYGWWPDSLNSILDGRTFDPISGSNVLKSAWCDIRPAGSGQERRAAFAG